MNLPDPCKLFGIRADYFGVEPQDVQFLGQLITGHPEWTTVIEFGTYCGVTALFMGLLMQEHGGQFVTIDQADNRIKKVQQAWLPNMEMHCMDILETPRN